MSAGLSQSALSKTTTYLESKWKVNSTNPTFFYFLGHNLQWAYWTTCDRATTCCTKCTTCQKAENFERLAPKNRDFWKSLILYKSNEPPKRHRKMKNLEWQDWYHILPKNVVFFWQNTLGKSCTYEPICKIAFWKQKVFRFS